MNKNQPSLPGFITGYSGPCTSSSRAFQMLVKSIGESKSRVEEDRIIRRELIVLKEKLKDSSISAKQMREYLVRLIYCEMLGHDASFGHIHAINFAQQPSLLNKRIGYLALCLFLHENHPLIVLLVNTLQRDLKSSNVIDICCALTVVCKVVSEEIIPALLPLVVAHLGHKRDIVRKKAVMALQKLFQKSPACIDNIKVHAKKAVGDHDYGVIGASLNIFHDLIMKDPNSCKDMTDTFVNIQKRIIEGKLPRDFDYHGVQAPWLQIKLLRIMGMLGVDDLLISIALALVGATNHYKTRVLDVFLSFRRRLSTSQKMYDVVGQTLFKLNINSLIGYAVAYEWTRTITNIYPNKTLVDKAAKCVGMFLINKNKDLKYLGLNALASLVQVNTNLATQPAYQRIIIDCLDDPDEMLKRKTLDLLSRITNATNVETVCNKLIGYLRVTVDSYFRAELVTRVTELAERYAPDNYWYIDTMNEIFELGGQFVRPEVAHNLMRLLAEGNDDEDADNELRAYAVSLYLDLLDKPVLPDLLIHLISWVIGEYSYTVSQYEPQVFLNKLCSLLSRTYEDSGTKGWIITAISKLLAQIGRFPEDVKIALDNQTSIVDVDMIQRCCEIHQLTKDVPLMQKVLPVDSSCEDLEIDPSLSFLDEFVTQALKDGAEPYKPKSQRQMGYISTLPETKQPVLKLTPYKTPTRRRNLNAETEPKHEEPAYKLTSKEQSNKELSSSPSETKPSGLSLHSGKKVWGPGGLVKGRGRSGSIDSSKSGSSSKSSEPERIPVRTSAQVTPAPLVMQTEEDYRKQQLARALFDGVGDTRQLQSKSRRGITLKKVTSRTTGATKPEEADSTSRKGTKHNDVKPQTDLLFGLDQFETSEKPDTAATPEEEGLDSTPLLQENPSTHMQPAQSCSSGIEQQGHSILDQDLEQNTNQIEISEENLPCIPESLSKFAHTKKLVELCTDNNLRITVQKVWKPTELVLVLVFTNQSQNQTKISDVCCDLQAPSNLRSWCESADDANIFIELLEPLHSEQHLVFLQYLSPALHMSMSGKVSYKDFSKTTKKIFIDQYIINMSDLLHPLEITTEQFEEKWKEAHFEKRLKIDSSRIQNIDDLAENSKHLMNLYPVEVIGVKVIACGTVQQKGVCLLHGKVEPDGSLELRVKSASQLLSDAVMRQCQNVFR